MWGREGGGHSTAVGMYALAASPQWPSHPLVQSTRVVSMPQNQTPQSTQCPLNRDHGLNHDHTHCHTSMHQETEASAAVCGRQSADAPE
jgi:hypothetical protein